MAKKDYTISDFIGGLVFLVVAFVVANPVLSILIVVTIVIIWFGGAELWKNTINPRKYKQNVWKPDNNKLYTNSRKQKKETKEGNIENQSVKKIGIENILDDSPIKLQACSKDDILSLTGFDEEKANKFIEDRSNGKVWYNIDSFAQDFKLEPHEIILIQDRLLFPIKPRVKIGKRRLDI